MVGQWHDPLTFALCIIGYIVIHIGWHHWKIEERKRYEIRHDYTIRKFGELYVFTDPMFDTRDNAWNIWWKTHHQ